MFKKKHIEAWSPIRVSFAAFPHCVSASWGDLELHSRQPQARGRLSVLRHALASYLYKLLGGARWNSVFCDLTSLAGGNIGAAAEVCFEYGLVSANTYMSFAMLTTTPFHRVSERKKITGETCRIVVC
jgi:hypothetical protein